MASRLTTRISFPTYFAGAGTALSISLFLIRLYHGIWFRSWGDELEHLLGGRALTRGDQLYVTFVDLHGPLIFFLAQTYGSLFGWSEANYARLIPASFFLLAAASIGLSPVLSDLRQRAWAVTVFFGIGASVWIVQGFYLLEYYLLSGALLTVCLASFAVPRWKGIEVSRMGAGLSGASTTLALFASHAWLPTAAALFVSATLNPWTKTSRRATATFVASAALTGVTFLLWLSRHGSLRGYVVFHIIFAHTVYLQAIGPVNPELTFSHFAASLVPTLSPEKIVQDLGIFALLSAIIAGVGLYQCWPLAIGVLGILATDARGDVGFQNGTFVVLSIALFALTIPQRSKLISETTVGSIAATCVCVSVIAIAELAARRAISSPNGLSRAMIIHDQPARIAMRSGAPEYSFIRTIVKPDERLLALVYRPWEYWLADRLPMLGCYEYLPDDALYASQPVFGIRRDLCKALQNDPPPAIIFDDWKVWNYYSPATYMPCVVRELFEFYTRSPTYPLLFVRRDRVPIARQGSPTPEARQERPGGP